MTVPAKLKAIVLSEFCALQQHLYTGVVEANHCEWRKYWNAWKTFATYCGVDPNFTSLGTATKIVTLLAFAEQVRTRLYGRGKKVCAWTDQVALRAIGKTFKLAGKQNPCHTTHNTYLTPITRTIEDFKQEDLLPQPKLAVPCTVPAFLMLKEAYRTNPKLTSYW